MRWHYTISRSLESILKDGFIRLATGFLLPTETPGVWFSSNPMWESTVTKGAAKSFKAVSDTWGAYRIGVPDDFPLINWRQFRNTYDSDTAGELERIAKGCGANPRQWFVSLSPVPVAGLLIQFFDTYRWIDWDGKTFTQMKGIEIDGYHIPPPQAINE